MPEENLTDLARWLRGATPAAHAAMRQIPPAAEVRPKRDLHGAGAPIGEGVTCAVVSFTSDGLVGVMPTAVAGQLFAADSDDAYLAIVSQHVCEVSVDDLELVSDSAIGRELIAEVLDMPMPKIGWNQPLCETCYVAWLLGRGEPPRTPSRVIDGDSDPCLICGKWTTIYTRINPELAVLFPNPRPDSDA